MIDHTQYQARHRKQVIPSLIIILTLWCTGIGTTSAEQANSHTPSAADNIAERYRSAQEMNGRVTIVGSDTMQPLMAKLAAAFRTFHPNTKFGVEGQGSSESIREFMLGLSFQRRGDKAGGRGTEGASSTALLASSRPLTDQERKGFTSNHGYEPLEIPIAMDAVAIYVNSENPLEQLTLEQIDGVFSSSFKRSKGGRLKTWGQLGVGGPWSQGSIHLVGRNKKSGTREFFKHVALLDGELHEDVKELPGSASEILAIAQDPLAIGYAGVGFHSSMVRIVPLAQTDGGAPVAPNAVSVANGQYPLARPLYLYVNKHPQDKLDPVIVEFLKFVNSQEGQEVVARANFYPLTAGQISKNRELLGTALLTAQYHIN